MLKQRSEQGAQWWSARSLRERYMLIIGGGLSGVLLCYLWLWLPLEERIAELRHQAIAKQRLLQWLKQDAEQLREAEHQRPLPQLTREAQVSVVARTLHSAGLQQALQGVSQDKVRGVAVHFRDVDFNALMHWLVMLQSKYGIHVIDSDVLRSSRSGRVNASLHLRSN